METLVGLLVVYYAVGFILTMRSRVMADAMASNNIGALIIILLFIFMPPTWVLWGPFYLYAMRRAA